MQHLLRPASARCGRQLEHRPAVVSAALVGRAVEIAGGIEDQAGLRDQPRPCRCRSYAAPSPSSPRPLRASTRTPSRSRKCRLLWSCRRDCRRHRRSGRRRDWPRPCRCWKLYSTFSWAAAQVLVTNRITVKIARAALNPMEDLLPRKVVLLNSAAKIWRIRGEYPRADAQSYPPRGWPGIALRREMG